jgi:hypothetical protein
MFIIGVHAAGRIADDCLIFSTFPGRAYSDRIAPFGRPIGTVGIPLIPAELAAEHQSAAPRMNSREQLQTTCTEGAAHISESTLITEATSSRCHATAARS